MKRGINITLPTRGTLFSVLLAIGACAVGQETLEPSPTESVAAGDVRLEEGAISPSSFGFPLPPSTSQLPDTTPAAAASTTPNPLDLLKAAYQSDVFERKFLTGDWFGARSELVDRGLLFYADSTLFYQGVTTGGLRQKFRFYGHNDYVGVGLGKRMGLWDGFLFKIRGETRYGDNAANLDSGSILSPAVGASLPVPNMQVTALTELLLIQRVGQRMLLQAGKVNTLDGDPLVFASGRGKTQFYNTAFVFNPVLARTVPYATLGAGFVWMTSDFQPVLAFSVLDANPSPLTSGFRNLFDDVTLTGSVRIPVQPFGRNGHQAFTGAWANKVYTGLELDPRVPIDDLPLVSGAPLLPRRHGSWALAYSFDQYLWQDETTPTRGWGLFGRLGLSDGDPNPIQWFWSLGLGGTGPTASRPLDSFGVGYYALGGKSGTILNEHLQLRDAYGVEMFYNYAITPAVRLTPDLQVLRGGISQADVALLFGLRLQVVF